jgi:hypothetical protein
MVTRVRGVEAGVDAAEKNREVRGDHIRDNAVNGG